MTWQLQPGDRIRRKQLHDQYGGSRQGGISPSRHTPNVFIFSQPSIGHEHGYFDHWEGDVFHYYGEGQHGDQEMLRGNKAILNHIDDGRALRVFDGAKGEVEYLGEFELDTDPPWFYDRAPETGGGPLRAAIVFRLVPEGQVVVEGATVQPSELEPTLNTAYREVDEDVETLPPSPPTGDPDSLGRSLRRHRQIQNQLAGRLRQRGIEPLSPGPGDPPFDIGWIEDDTFVVGEVKSLSPTNETNQLRRGLGQVLDYEDIITRSGREARAVLVVEHEPTETRWVELCRRHGVEVLWV